MERTTIIESTTIRTSEIYLPSMVDDRAKFKSKILIQPKEKANGNEKEEVV